MIATIQEVVAYFHRNAPIVSRRIHHIDAAVQMNDGAIPQLSQYNRESHRPDSHLAGLAKLYWEIRKQGT